MTRIVLILTAVPLAAILALVFNLLLERAAQQRQAVKSLVFLFSATLLLSLVAVVPATAGTESSGGNCASIECSLSVDRQDLDELWSKRQPRKVRLLYQSRIPVTEQTLRDTGDSLLVDERGRRRPPTGSAGQDVSPSLRAPLF